MNNDAVVLNFKGVLGGSFIKSNNKTKIGTILNLYCTNFRITLKNKSIFLENKNNV